MSAQSDAFYAEVLRRCRRPVDAANIFLCHAWAAEEGGSARYNPFNTTEPYAHATNYNSVGVKNYASAADGIAATVMTLENGRYGAILDGLAHSDPVATGRAIDHSPWGTHGVETYVRAHWHAAPPHHRPAYPGHVIAYGSTDHANVRLVQARVFVTVDGLFGPNTRAAVILWQHRHPPLVADGVVGPLTWRAMFG